MKINEIYYSLQGEGCTMGIPTAFIRLTGCNLRCEWCDTLFAYDEGKEMSIEEVIAAIGEMETNQICITGGEPLAQAETLDLIEELLEMNYLIVLETNGSLNLELLPCSDNFMISMDIKCPSSGMAENMVMDNLELLGPNDQLKFIISDDIDYQYAKSIMAGHEPACNIVMTPVGGSCLKNLAEWVLRDGLAVRVLPQLHKLIWGNERCR